ncbi:DcaP family trimeric outer membrane transporter [Aestuariibacter sp. A3R04]|uniref:DcaP family trimeric outer membrane transporter n=1 Tax=Aestuariibacter sp. A3R04 TaxID=2841571 RepID=UPI001C0862AB|nr:DcaP family trimeric outer membrane transporter [Aestuariibacter sp. A3R04]MBU3024023.1 porin [Aestuariibacter sp. A3R04]
MTHTFKKSALSLSVVAASLMATTAIQAASLGSTDIAFTGYVKADAMVSNYSEGNLGAGSIGREFYIPSLTPVSGNDEGTQFDSHIRQSRFRFTSNTETPEGDTVTGVLELDFLVTDGGNERVSNSYTPRVRHAFIKYKNWLVGQTWTTFMDVGSLPESLDFIGTTDGITFGRQVMVRYSQGGFQFALENPETTITPFGGGGRIVADDNAVPDVIANYTWKQDWGYVKVAGIVRQLSYDDGGAIDDDETSYGVQLSGKFTVNNGDDIRWTFNTGAGLGRYAALNASNGAVITANNELEAIDSMGYSIAYRHLWSDKMRSSIMFSALDIDNDTSLTGTGVTESTYSSRVNLLYSPTKSLTVGAEYAYAKRETEGGLDGDMNRIQVSAKYAF